MSKSVKELIKSAQEASTGRKTKNNDLYYDIIVTLCEDDEYVAETGSSLKYILDTIVERVDEILAAKGYIDGRKVKCKIRT